MSTRSPRPAVALVALALLAAACSGHTATTSPPEPPIAETAPAVAPTAPASSPVPVVDEKAIAPSERPVLAILDGSIPEGVEDERVCYVILPPECLYDDLESITCASDVAFIGRITDYSERVLPSSSSRWIIDGVVFTVDELLKGDIGADGGAVTILLLTVEVDDDGDPIARIGYGPIGVIRQGIARRHAADRPSYLVYASAAAQDGPRRLRGALVFNTDGGVAPVMDDGSLRQGVARPFVAGHGLRVEDARRAARDARQVCVRAPLPPGVREIWFNVVELQYTVDEDVWADRLARVCEAALGGSIDSPVWDREAARRLAEEFADADGLRPDLPPEWRERYLEDAAGELWRMIVHRAESDGPSACWHAVPQSFLEDAPPLSTWTGPEDFYTIMTDEVYQELIQRRDSRLYWVQPPLPPGIRELWWTAVGAPFAIDEDLWAARLNLACNTPFGDPQWDRSLARSLALKFMQDDGVESYPALVEAGADALWRMTTDPLVGACPWHYPAGTFEPEFVEHMNELRRAAPR